ncbi:hypothetical protein KIK06_24175 [Nocardiopsis sp. EMB25]|uniref:hypothetical protein n=1 Tax=Nocardiopsis sp. EMB25 TaxID=2835867 RepID=UPI0022849F73|nr:hypothetical protein [Nocardiopsis sp. EMB25]MCY9786986.1 hypothetical protein [Nocardiopsis sp. EMB25]
MSAKTGPDILLRLLKSHYGDQWSIRRHGRLWVATTTNADATHAPTLIEENVEVFANQLEHPPNGIGNADLLPARIAQGGRRIGGAEDGPPEG